MFVQCNAMSLVEKFDKPDIRFDAQLVHEMTSGLLVGSQRVSLTSAPVQGQHQLSPQPLVQAMRGHQYFELCDRLPGTV
jgi:hypothetical protein